ncbi:MAG: nickel pincer cofactor biosynthesis protein LarB [Bacteriovoracaceae bacterium]|nr:nickel pincer cofactor biosynthesis protein LarB [Bacteriovoracaceae bacterium]
MIEYDLDFNRKDRLGFPEVIYGEYKSTKQLLEIIDQFILQKENILITRLQPDKAQAISAKLPDGNYNELAKTFTHNFKPVTVKANLQQVKIIAAGTSDAYVVEEIKQTLSFLGVGHTAFMDKGIAGLHRIKAVLPDILQSDVIICVAGLEGALPSVLAGIISNPIIAVPTSVGYGISTGGHTALNAMLSSCANGITVVNIDNGFGAALAAFRLAHSGAAFERT